MKYLDYWTYLLLSTMKLLLFSALTATAFDASFLCINVASILILTGWALAIKREWRQWILYTSLFLHSSLLISDVWYYRYFDDLLSVALLSEIGQMGDVGGGFLTLIQPIDFLFFIDLIMYGAVLLYIKRNPISERQERGRQLALLGFIFGLLVFSTPLVTSIQRGEKWITDAPVSNMREYYQLGFWGYHGLDVARGAGRALKWNDSLTETERQRVLALSLRNVSAASPRTNVVVVQLESFQTSLIGLQINGQDVTPNLNRLRDETLYFPNFYHQTHEGRTSDAELIVNTSLHPVKSGSVYTRFPDHEFNALPKTLKEFGYDTAAMHAFDKHFWNRDDFYRQIDFNHFFSKEDYPDGDVIGMALNDKDFLTTSVAFSDTLNEPFYTFMVALTSHIPYDIPAEEKRLDLSGYDDPLLRNYYHTAHYVDAAVGLMVQQLKLNRMWDDTLIVLYGDHDSGLTRPENEMALKSNSTSALELFQLDKKVPLFIKPPGLSTGRVMLENGGQIDLAPTILHLLGISQSFMLGDSLLNDEPNLTVFRDGAFRYDDLLYLPDLTQASGNGTCYSTETKTTIAFSYCQPYIDKAEDQLRLSDTLIEKNALSQVNPR